LLADLYIESVLMKCETLKKCGLWAPEPHLRPTAWLDNFADPQDRLLAAIVLDNFVYYADRGANRLLRSAYDRLEDDLLIGRIPRPTSFVTPEAFLDNLIFTPIEGEDPRPTDSGKTICKTLRDVVELNDERFFDPRSALLKASVGHPIVFVDDFIGSGEQLIKTWRRPYLTSPISFEEAHAKNPFVALCLVMVATQKALDNIRDVKIPVHVIATHILDEGYSIQNLEAPTITPPLQGFQVLLEEFLRKHAKTLALDSFLRLGDQPLYGFHELGLLYATQGSVPDSTVPILWATGTGSWVRLVRKNA
jgi:hypothetical protein